MLSEQRWMPIKAYQKQKELLITFSSDFVNLKGVEHCDLWLLS